MQEYLKSVQDRTCPQPNGAAVMEKAIRWAVEARRKEEAEGNTEAQVGDSGEECKKGRV